MEQTRHRIRAVAAAVTVMVALATAALPAQRGGDDYLAWTRKEAQALGEAMRRADRVGNRMSFRGLKTDRAISYKMRATWLTPEVIRATARLIQLNERLSPERTRALVAEADAAGDAVFLVEIDPDEGSGIVPEGWTATLQPRGLPPGGEGAIEGTVTPALRNVRALAGVFRRDYAYDAFWVAFSLAGEPARRLTRGAGGEIELIVNIQGREGIVSWLAPRYLSTLAGAGE